MGDRRDGRNNHVIEPLPSCRFQPSRDRGCTPKALPGPSHTLPNSGDVVTDPNDISKLDD
jgi:hypothetical protein